MWKCETQLPAPVLTWASPTDMSGTYGLTEVKCTRIDFGAPGGHALSFLRAWAKVVEILGEL